MAKKFVNYTDIESLKILYIDDFFPDDLILDHNNDDDFFQYDEQYKFAGRTIRDLPKDYRSQPQNTVKDISTNLIEFLFVDEENNQLITEDNFILSGFYFSTQIYTDKIIDYSNIEE
jgi:hypothetical protein